MLRRFRRVHTFFFKLCNFDPGPGLLGLDAPSVEIM